MTKSNWKRISFAVAALSVLGAGLFYFIPVTSAAASFPPVGTINPCAGWKDHPIELPGGLGFNSHTQGGINVEVGTHFRTTDGRNGANLIIRSVSSAGQVDGVGFVEIGSDASRSSRSTLVANQTGSDYPATQTMRFFPTVTIDGKEFRALNAANLVNSAVTSTPPAVGTVYVLTNEVALESADDPGKVAMTIKPSKAFTVTGHVIK